MLITLNGIDNALLEKRVNYNGSDRVLSNGRKKYLFVTFFGRGSILKSVRLLTARTSANFQAIVSNVGSLFCIVELSEDVCFLSNEYFVVKNFFPCRECVKK